MVRQGWLIKNLPRLFQDGIDIFPGFRLTELVQKIAKALLDRDADPSIVWQIQLSDRLEHIVLIDCFYLHIRHQSSEQSEMIYEHDQYLELPMTSSYSSSARNYCCQALLASTCMRALAWARVPAWAWRLGAGRPVGPGVRGGLSPEGAALRRAGFLETNDCLLLLAEN